jgi:hypothetical protein
MFQGFWYPYHWAQMNRTSILSTTFACQSPFTVNQKIPNTVAFNLQNRMSTSFPFLIKWELTGVMILQAIRNPKL